MQKRENILKVLFLGRREEGGIRGLYQNYYATGSIDIVFLILVMYLVVMGTVMMFSAGYVKAESETGDPFDFLKSHVVFLAIGLVGMLIASKVKPRLYKRFALSIFIVALILLVIVLFYHTSVHSAEGDAYKRWIPIGSFTFQPSDIAKVALVIFLAALMDNCRENLETKWYYVLLLLLPVALMAFLVLLEKHFSATFLLVAIGVLMIFLGGGKQWVFVVGVIIALLGIVLKVGSTETMTL